MGVNDVIFDRNVRHQIGLTRLATGTSRELAGVLSEFDARIQRLTSQIHAGSSQGAVNRILRRIEEVNHDAYQALGSAMARQMLDVAKYEVDFQGNILTGALGKQVADKLNIRGPSREQLEGAVKDHAMAGGKLSEHVEAMEQGRMRRIREAIRREHQIGGTGVEDGINRAIFGSAFAHYTDGVLGLGLRSLEQVTKTVVTGITNEARDLLFETNDEIFSGVMWVSVLDNRTSSICQSLDGSIFPLNEGPRPPAHPNCRSEITPIVRSWEELGLPDLGPGTRESMDGEVPENMTYPEWLKRQPAKVQDEALGPNRGKMFREGVSLDRFVDDTGRRYTLDELRRREGLG